jgi:DNA-binding GntR family transcriptional regulator
MPYIQKTKKHRAYESIKAMIVSNHARLGDAFTELSLSKTLKMGRTPIREALNLLEKDGLIHLLPNKGFFVNRISSARCSTDWPLGTPHSESTEGN